MVVGSTMLRVDVSKVRGGVKRCSWSRRFMRNTNPDEGAFLGRMDVFLAFLRPRSNEAMLGRKTSSCGEQKEIVTTDSRARLCTLRCFVCMAAQNYYMSLGVF